jgi:Mg2+ and Co2+ transporter CorA
MTDLQDSSSNTPTSPNRAVHYDPEAARSQSPDLSHHGPQTRQSFLSEPDVSNPNATPILKRRQTRASTINTYRAVNAYPLRPNWHPGQEPGLDPSKPNGGRAQLPMLRADCDITVVDYSEDDMVMRHLDNTTLPGWLEKEGKREEWVKCRWIDVNGLSWDVIQALGKYKRLHRLALEDLINTKNRTKADW